MKQKLPFRESKQRPILNSLILLIGVALTFLIFWMMTTLNSAKREEQITFELLGREMAEIVKGAPTFRVLMKQWPEPDPAVEARFTMYLQRLRDTYRMKDIAILGIGENKKSVYILTEDKHSDTFLLWLHALNEKIQEFNHKGIEDQLNAGKSNKFYATKIVDDTKGRLVLLAFSGFDLSNETTVHKIKWLPYFLVIIVALVVLLVVVVIFPRRKHSSTSMIVESVLVFVLGLLLAGSFYIVFEYKEHLDHIRVFRSFSENRLHNFRLVLGSIRSELSLTKSFFSGSEEVTESELQIFTSTFAEVKPYYEAFYLIRLLETSTEDTSANLHSQVEVLMKSIPENRGCESAASFPINESILQLLRKSYETQLFNASIVIDSNLFDSKKTCLVVTLPVELGNARVPKDKNNLLLVFLNPQTLMNETMSDGNALSAIMPIGLAYSESGMPNSLNWVATYPSEHLLLHKGEKVPQHLAEYELSMKFPLFFGGQTFYLLTHNSAELRYALSEDNGIFIFISIVLVSMLLSIIIYQLRSYWVRLEEAVEQRTSHLNKKINELGILTELNTLLTEGNDIASALGWLCNRFNKDKELSKDYILAIAYQGKFTCEDLTNVDGHSICRLNIIEADNNVGSIELFRRDENIGHIEEEHPEQFIEQLHFKINSWIAFVHATHQLSEAEERLSKLVESSFDGIYMLQNDRFIWVNQAFADIVEYTREELTDENFNIDKLLTPFSFEVIAKRKEMRSRGETPPHRFDFQQLTKSGKIVDVEISLVTVDYSKTSLVFGIVRDVTDQRLMERSLQDSEERLQQQNEELQLINEELTASNTHMRELNLALSEAHRRAEAGDRLKTAFLNNISHEVRTPLNGICGASEILANPDLELSEKREMIEILNVSTRRLLRTITQYMDISLLESGNMPVILNETSFSSIMNPIIEEFDSQCRKRGLALNYHNRTGDYILYTDKSLVEKAVSHLLENAIKFTPRGSVNVTAEIVDDTASIEIQDTGLGMAKQFHARVFDLFMQEDSSDRRKFDGSGLGLPIVKHIMKLLKGNVSFESEHGKGSTFRISFPVKQVAKNATTTEIPENPNPEPAHILIAEDEDSNFLVLKLLIERKLKARISRAENGEKAVEIVRTSKDIQLVLMDIKMPLIDGYEATKLIKALRPELPIIAITAYGLSGDEQRALDAGCDDYIAKPVQAGVMFQKIARLTGVK